MNKRDGTKAEEWLDGPRPIDDAEAAMIVAGFDDDDDTNVNEKCHVVGCPC